jgi:predicted  nucleic acid-binding Zn-ribbon protein
MEIIGAIGGLVAVVFGTPSIILFLLNRKNANKKLELEEGTLGVAQFEAQTNAYKDLLNRANKSLDESNATSRGYAAELKSYKEERETLMATVKKQGEEIGELKQADEDKSSELADTRQKLERLRSLFLAYVDRTGIPMTLEEKKIFEDTLPKELFRRRFIQGKGELA